MSVKVHWVAKLGTKSIPEAQLHCGTPASRNFHFMGREKMPSCKPETTEQKRNNHKGYMSRDLLRLNKPSDTPCPHGCSFCSIALALFHDNLTPAGLSLVCHCKRKKIWLILIRWRTLRMYLQIRSFDAVTNSEVLALIMDFTLVQL